MTAKNKMPMRTIRWTSERMKTLILLGLAVLGWTTGSTQATKHSGWLFISHAQKLSPKFDFLADVQLRSANKFDYLTTLLLRGAINYNFTKVFSTALGYPYKGDWEKAEEAPLTLL